MSAGTASSSSNQGGWEDKLAEVEARLQTVRDEKQAADVAKRESDRRCKRLEARIEELEQQLTVSRAELEETKEARRGDARALLSDAKEKLDTLHKEVSRRPH
jgi:DNA repair exonuclease SbcCD ATPase subunit